MALHYAMYLQHLSLEAFDPLSDLSYRLHGEEWKRRKPQELGAANAGVVFDDVVRATPSFRLEGDGWVGVRCSLDKNTTASQKVQKCSAAAADSGHHHDPAARKR